jgi:hypothetical protein
MLSVHGRLAEARIEQEVWIDDVTDRQIDQLVYDLYSLTDKEVRIVPDPAPFARAARTARGS